MGVSVREDPQPPAHRSLLSASEFSEMIGHLVRRSQQLHASLWAEHVGGILTSPQFAVLHAISAEAPIDQTTVGARVSLDRSTAADVTRRLVARRLITRTRDPRDGRRNCLEMTAAGRAELASAEPDVLAVNQMMLERIPPEDRSELIRLLNLLVTPGDSPADGEDADPS